MWPPSVTAGILTVNTVTILCIVYMVYTGSCSDLPGFAISFAPIFPHLFSLPPFTIWRLAPPSLYRRLLSPLWPSLKYGADGSFYRNTPQSGALFTKTFFVVCYISVFTNTNLFCFNFVTLSLFF